LLLAAASTTSCSRRSSPKVTQLAATVELDARRSGDVVTQVLVDRRVLAAGSRIWERGPTGWTAVTSSTPLITGLVAFGTDGYWASARNATVMQRTGQGWVAHKLPEIRYFDLISAGRWEGQAWVWTTQELFQLDVASGAFKLQPIPWLGDRWLGATWGSSGSAFFAVHPKKTGTRVQIVRTRGGTPISEFEAHKGSISDMDGTSDDDAWAVGTLVKFIGKGPACYYFDGRGWREIALPASGPAYSVLSVARGEAWIGMGESQLVHVRAGAIQVYSVDRAGDIVDVARDGRSLLLATSSDRILRVTLPTP
jgi:hypothetical protein